MRGEGTVAEVLAGEARYAVVCGDAAEVLPTIADASCAAIVTDPPSGIAFMGAEWDRDKGGRSQWIAWLASILGEARRCVRDGGRSVVWSLPRTSHWTGCAVEDAGWFVENTIQHLFATGWPKGKSQLKPAQETWWLARNGRSVALNIDACRVNGSKPGTTRGAGGQNGILGAIGAQGRIEDDGRGRYPSNVVFSHATGCSRVGDRKVRASNFAGGGPRVGAVYGGDDRERPPAGYADANGEETVEAWECVDGCPVAELAAQSGVSVSVDNPRHNSARPVTPSKGAEAAHVTGGFSDQGTASRFFPCFPADPAVFRYVAKPSRAEKSEGVGLDARPADAFASHRGRRMEEPSRFDGAPVTSAGNDHPTVKSVALMRWLVDLVSQSGDVVLDPFAGSGTTGVACLASGRRVILVEREHRFAEIARHRLQYWGAEWSAPARASQRRATTKRDEQQRELFSIGGTKP